MAPMTTTFPPRAKRALLAPAEIAAAARRAVDVASDKQASDILLLDVREVASFADYMIIMSAVTPRQTDALAGDITVAGKASGLALHHREGTAASGWLLLDFGDVIVHIFDEEQREHYRLEELWEVAKTVVRLQ